MTGTSLLNIQVFIERIHLYKRIQLVKTKAKGTRIENEFKCYFEKWGYLVTRAAGSFGIDLVAMKKGYKPLLINVKALRKYCGPAERKELIENAYKVDGYPVLAYIHIPRNRKRGKHAVEKLDSVINSRASPVVLESLQKCSPEMMDIYFGVPGPLSKVGVLSELHPCIPQVK